MVYTAEEQRRKWHEDEVLYYARRGCCSGRLLVGCSTNGVHRVHIAVHGRRTVDAGKSPSSADIRARADGLAHRRAASGCETREAREAVKTSPHNREEILRVQETASEASEAADSASETDAVGRRVNFGANQTKGGGSLDRHFLFIFREATSSSQPCGV